MMVCSLAEAYHWSLREIFDLTMPQIVMLNHAAFISGKRFDARMERDRGKVGEVYDSEGKPRQKTVKEKWGEDPLIDGTTRLSEISTDFDKLRRYLTF
jgi:hypothetical protein